MSQIMRLHFTSFWIILVALISLALVPGDAWAGKHHSNHNSAARGGAHPHKLATDNARPTNQNAFRQSTSVTNSNPGKLPVGGSQTPVGGNQSTARSTRVVKQRYIDRAGKVRIRTVRVAD
jgi:hypothetical protein